jgi:arginase
LKISIIQAPYDSGHYQSGFGLGPEAIIAAGLVDELTLSGHDVTVHDIGRVGDAQEREIATGFAVCRAVAELVTNSRSRGSFPIVLSGNCLTTVGAVAGDAADSIIWADQHGDINTPETSTSGFLDGMALATVLGLCWRQTASGVRGFRAIDPARCLLVDARDLDAGEREVLESLPVLRAQTSDVVGEIAKLKSAGATRTHLHLDLDVHNPRTLQANRYTMSGGPSPKQLREMASAVARSIPVVGISISAYDPSFDAHSDVPQVVGKLLVDFLATLERI